MLRWRSNTRRW